MIQLPSNRQTECSRPDSSRDGAGATIFRNIYCTILISCIFLGIGTLALADGLPPWTKDYLDCGEGPIALFLQIGPFSYGDEIDIRNILAGPKLADIRSQFLVKYPQCKITPILEFLVVSQKKYLADNNIRSGTDPLNSDIIGAFHSIADRYPEARIPFDFRADDEHYPAGASIAPASLMCIADMRSKMPENIVPSVAAAWEKEAENAWQEILKRFPEEKPGPNQHFSTKALAKLITKYGCLAGESACITQPDNARKFSRIALDQYPNLPYNDGHYCGTLHPHALFALAVTETDGRKVCGHLQEILRKHAEEGFFACETDAGSIIGYGALDMMNDRCKETRSCIPCYQNVVGDPGISNEWKGRAQYKLAVYYQATLHDYRQAIEEYKILANRFGDGVENDEEDMPQESFNQLADERIKSLERYLVENPAADN